MPASEVHLARDPDADFEHLKDDDDAADTQALGQANDDQTQALDQSKGVESDTICAIVG
jgi:midasin (ATPase involved in ribosome maturation)